MQLSHQKVDIGRMKKNVIYLYAVDKRLILDAKKLIVWKQKVKTRYHLMETKRGLRYINYTIIIDKGCYYRLIKGSILQRDITIITYTPNIEPQIIWCKHVRIKERNSSTVGHFNNLLSVMDRTTKRIIMSL